MMLFREFRGYFVGILAARLLLACWGVWPSMVALLLQCMALEEIARN